MSKKTEIIKLHTTTFLNRVEIAERVGCKPPYITQVLLEASLSKASVDDSRTQALFLQIKGTLARRLSQLNRMIEDGDNLRAMDREMKYLERMCKMFGFDAPDRVLVATIPTNFTFEVIKDVDVTGD